jgi:dTDP-4-dehydrorhamnose reductase
MSLMVSNSYRRRYSMKIGITGYKGRLGSELIKQGCLPLDGNVMLKGAIQKFLDDVQPDIVIHCAALTDVDKCDKFRNGSLELNARAVENLKVCFSGKIVLLSTDYVFNGKGKGMYTEMDQTSDPNTLCWYGYTKLIAEEFLGNNDTIVRTTILYGSPVKGDFVTSILDKLENGEPFTVTKSLFGTPTYVPHLAKGIMTFLDIASYTHLPVPHIINIAGGDYLNRYDFAMLIASVFGYDKAKKLILPTTAMGTVKRPRHAGLSTKLAEKMGIKIYSVLDGLDAFREEQKIWKQLNLPL